MKSCIFYSFIFDSSPRTGASKAALDSITKTMALELGPKQVGQRLETSIYKHVRPPRLCGFLRFLFPNFAFCSCDSAFFNLISHNSIT